MGAPRTVSTNRIDNSYDIILFDGVCNFCSASVIFIIKRDPDHRFKFASLQSSVAREMLMAFAVNPDLLSSIILIRGQCLYKESDAVLEILKNLRGLWPIFFYLGKIMPRFVRDFAYRQISLRRYRLFGKRESCMIPTPDIRSRFLE